MTPGGQITGNNCDCHNGLLWLIPEWPLDLKPESAAPGDPDDLYWWDCKGVRSLLVILTKDNSIDSNTALFRPIHGIDGRLKIAEGGGIKQMHSLKTEWKAECSITPKKLKSAFSPLISHSCLDTGFETFWAFDPQVMYKNKRACPRIQVGWSWFLWQRLSICCSQQHTLGTAGTTRVFAICL